MGEGTSPVSMIFLRWREACGSAIGTADSSAWVYGWDGFAYSSVFGAISTTKPRYMTAILSEIISTTDRSCEMNM